MRRVLRWTAFVVGLVGVVGLIAPSALGGHPGLLHNGIHIGAACLALYFGTRGTWEGARAFCAVLGALYLVMGVGGLVFGSPGSMMGMAPSDARAWHLIPGRLEFGSVDHIVHAAAGLACVWAAWRAGRPPRTTIRTRDRDREIVTTY